MAADITKDKPAQTHDERLHWVLPDVETALVPHTSPVPDTETPLPDVKPTRQMPTRIGRITFSPSQWVQAQLVTEARYGTGFVLAPVAFGLGAIVYFALPVEPAFYNIASACVVMVALLAIAIKQAVHPAMMRSLIALTLITVGMAAGQIRTHMVATPMVGSEVTTTLTGRVVTIERRANGSARYTIDIVKTERPFLRYAPDRIRVTARKQDDQFASGDGITGRVRLTSPSGPFRPDGFDFAFHNYFAGIGANGFFYGAPRPAELNAQEGVGPWLARLFRNGRMELGQRIIARSGQDAGAAVSAALVTGDKAPIPEDVSDALRMSGLAHILTISGLHMALVAGAVMIAIRAGLALAPNYAAGRSTKKIAACWALGFVAIYLFLAGASVATQRSFIMLSVMLGALLIDRAAITMRNLAIAAMIVLLIAPEAITGPSFQMSFAATAALIATYAMASRRVDKSRSPFVSHGMIRSASTTVLKYAGGLALTAIVAGAATGLYAGYHFNRIAPFGLLANVAAVPIVSLVTMPLAVLGMLAMPFGLDGFVFSAMAWSVEQVIAVAQFVVSISPSGSIGAMPKPAMLAGSAGLMVVCLLRSQLRWLGILPLVGCFVLMGTRETPIALVTEDAKQFGVLVYGEEAIMAVNRSRPNGFTMEQWQPAFQIEGLEKPQGEERFDWTEIGYPQERMACDEKLCLIAQGAPQANPINFAYLSKALTEPEAAHALCQSAHVIIHAYAPSQPICSSQSIAEITAQDLALHGSVAIYRQKPASAGISPVRLRHAIGANLRPWHTHRQFSRSARNLAPWQPRTQ